MTLDYKASDSLILEFINQNITLQMKHIPNTSGILNFDFINFRLGKL